MLVFVYFLLYILPLVLIPYGETYEIGKVLLAQLAIEIIVFTLILKKQLTSLIKHPRLMLLIALIYILSITALIFTPLQSNLFGNSHRSQGTYLLWHLLALSLVAASFTKNYIHKFYAILTLLLLLVTGLLGGGTEAGRAYGALGEPNALAASGIFLWPLTWSLSGWLVAFSLIFISGSRSGFLALALQTLFLILIKKFKISLKSATIWSLIILTAFYLLAYSEKSGVLEQRGQIWKTSLVAGLQNPIIGGGFGNSESLIRQGAIKLGNSLRFQRVDDAHNFILNWWIQAGFVGVMLLLYLLYFTLKNYIQHKRLVELVILLGLLTVSSFNPTSVVTLVGFWWLIGQGFTARPVEGHPIISPF